MTPAGKVRLANKQTIVEYLKLHANPDGTVSQSDVADMATEYGYSTATINNYAREAKLPFRSPGNAQGALRTGLTILSHWMQGKSLAEAGREAEVSREYARSVVEQAKEIGFLDVARKWKGRE